MYKNAGQSNAHAIAVAEAPRRHPQFDNPEPAVTGVAVGIVGLEIAVAAVVILELPL